jgi:hypothetical protein
MLAGLPHLVKNEASTPKASPPRMIHVLGVQNLRSIGISSFHIFDGFENTYFSIKIFNCYSSDNNMFKNQLHPTDFIDRANGFEARGAPITFAPGAWLKQAYKPA